jgi:glutaminase
MPEHGAQIQEILDGVYHKFKDVSEGTVATYIPELGKANPEHFGICLATVDGYIFQAGDCDQEFTIQSMCKPFAFQMALEQCGLGETLKHVGVEPSGDAFNSIELDAKTSRPFNPMINAGAIAISSLIKKSPVEAGVKAFVDRMSDAAGRQLRIDQDVMQSETLTGNRNRAIAYLMRNFGIIDEEVNESLHQYFAQCSMLVNLPGHGDAGGDVRQHGRQSRHRQAGVRLPIPEVRADGDVHLRAVRLRGRLGL